MDDEVAASASTELAAAGHRVSAPTVAKLLKAEGFSLQANAKVIEGADIPIVMPSSTTSTTRPATTSAAATR